MSEPAQSSLPKSVKRWSFYNFANHGYQTVYVAFLLPVFFSEILITKGYSLAAWGIANGVSTAIGVIAAVIIGRYSDQHDKLKTFRLSIALSFLGMLILSFSALYFPSLFYLFFIATNAIFIWSVSLSDSILPHISNNQTAYEYGGFAWGMGYAGGIASLIIAIALQYIAGNYSLLVFISVPIFYLIFSWYSVAGLKEIQFKTPAPIQEKTIISRKQKGVLLLGYWLISESITIIGLFAAIYFSKELKLSAMQIGLLFIVIDLIAFPATWFGGRLAHKYNSLKLLGYALLLWGIALIIFILPHVGWLWIGIAVILIGLAYGNSQSYLRSQYSTIIKRSESGFQFGIYSILSEAAVTIGPIIYGFASDRLHSQKMPMLFLIICLVLGYWLVWKIIRSIEIVKQN